MKKEVKKIQLTLFLPKDRKNLTNPKPLPNFQVTVCIPTQFNEADFIKALFELQRLAPKTTVLLQTKQTKKQVPIPLRKIEYIHFRKYKAYENEYELIFDEVDYQTLLYAMKKQCKEMGVL
ncbi:hypothetical protein HB837_14485 [Listeria innocua]|uniref:hypothetical protein n=1 Tax=Listeria innocua TaxID=1642 RepID=UPI001628FBF3|nr:hypothetical protein [Listeria innocua]MBC1339403.1 hypothetical protein [Listeria innocua]MBC1353643.1 hypothetical protein [Listeria innocua]